MLGYQEAFISFAIDQGVLKFGEFVLKSGRTSPWFFNSGLFRTGQALAKLGHYYSEAIMDDQLKFDILFGPAYKGIPLVCATSIALANDYDLDAPYVFNRKEVKDHGEGGNLVGAELTGQALVIDDVITAGTAIREAVSIIEGSAAKLCGVVIAVDRQERGQGEMSAIQEVERTHGVSVTSIVTFADILEYLQNHGFEQNLIDEMRNYHIMYGV